jgi:glycosyltransferase involved in cell wall biosynthesis
MFKHGLNCFGQCHLCAAFSFAKRNASKQVDGVVGNSNFILKRHLEAGYFPKSSVRTVISNISGVCSTFRRNQNWSSAGPVKVGFLGRLHPSKGVETLLEAVKDVSPDSVVVRIGGEGQREYEQKLRTSYRQPNVQFLGRVDAADFLKTVDLLVVPSLWHDPLPRVIFEAYACGVPVICSDRGGSKEIVAEGVSGFVFNGGDSASLRALLLRLANESGLLNTLGRGAADLALRFTSDEIASAYEEVYLQVIKG